MPTKLPSVDGSALARAFFTLMGHLNPSPSGECKSKSTDGRRTVSTPPPVVRLAIFHPPACRSIGLDETRSAKRRALKLRSKPGRALSKSEPELAGDNPPNLNRRLR